MNQKKAFIVTLDNGTKIQTTGANETEAKNNIFPFKSSQVTKVEEGKLREVNPKLH